MRAQVLEVRGGPEVRASSSRQIEPAEVDSTTYPGTSIFLIRDYVVPSPGTALFLTGKGLFFGRAGGPGGLEDWSSIISIKSTTPFSDLRFAFHRIYVKRKPNWN